jgi:predicted ester cyclase
MIRAGGRDDIKAFMTDFRKAFPDLNFWGTADLIAEGDYVVGRWEGGGTHTGPAYNDFLAGSLPAATGRKMHFTGTTVLRLKDGRIVEEKGLDDGVAHPARSDPRRLIDAGPFPDDRSLDSEEARA